VKRLQTVGIDLGMAPGLENVHWLIDEAFSSKGRLSDHFLAAVMGLTSYDGGPLFAVLQESIYGTWPRGDPVGCRARRAEHPAFDPAARPLLFTGEMMFPWMFEEIRSLRPFQAGAEALAAREVYLELYDPPAWRPTRFRSRRSSITTTSMSMRAFRWIPAGEVGNLQHWVTNEFEHDGIRQDGKVFKRLLEMIRENGGPRLQS
jgi:proline iminopeptidase